jgi:hypothetical protein
MGTYKFKPFSVFSRSNGALNWYRTSLNIATDQDIIDGCFQEPPVTSPSFRYGNVTIGTGIGLLTFTGKFYLDGSATPLGINDLPSGFTLDTVVWTGRLTSVTWANYLLSYDVEVTFANEIDVNPPSVAGFTATITPAVLPSLAALNGFLKFNVNKFQNAASTPLVSIYVEGDYHLLAFTFTFNQDGDSVSPGAIISITSDPLDPNFMDLTHVTLSVTCGVIVPIVQTTHLFTFAVPAACDGNGSTVLTATGDGFQFSGSVALGTLNILLVNGSGIYHLVTGQRHDQLYSDLRDGTTVSLKIPNPMAKTGFVGG